MKNHKYEYTRQYARYHTRFIHMCLMDNTTKQTTLVMKNFLEGASLKSDFYVKLE